MRRQPLAAPYAGKVASLRALIAVLDGEIARLAEQAAGMLAQDKGYAAVRQLPGIGPVLAAVIIAKAGDVTRFGKPGQLCNSAEPTPRHYDSDSKVIRGHCSKQGSRMCAGRWSRRSSTTARRPAAAGPGGDHRPPRPRSAEHRQDRRRPRPAHPGVLRPARRPRPLRGAPGRVDTAGPGRARGRDDVLPARARPGGADEDVIDPRPDLTRTAPCTPGQPGQGTTKG